MLLANAASVLVTWRANPESDIRNYRLTVRPEGAAVPAQLVETPALSAEVDGLADGQTYAFNLIAVNTSGMRSGVSPTTLYTVKNKTGIVVMPYEWSANCVDWYPFCELRLPAPMTLPDGSQPDKLFFRQSHPTQQDQ